MVKALLQYQLFNNEDVKFKKMFCLAYDDVVSQDLFLLSTKVHLFSSQAQPITINGTTCYKKVNGTTSANKLPFITTTYTIYDTAIRGGTP